MCPSKSVMITASGDVSTNVRKLLLDRPVTAFSACLRVCDVPAQRNDLLSLFGVDDAGIDFARELSCRPGRENPLPIPNGPLLQTFADFPGIAFNIVGCGPFHHAPTDDLAEAAMAGQPDILHIGIHHAAFFVKNQVACVRSFHQMAVLCLALAMASSARFRSVMSVITTARRSGLPLSSRMTKLFCQVETDLPGVKASTIHPANNRSRNKAGSISCFPRRLDSSE